MVGSHQQPASGDEPEPGPRNDEAGGEEAGGESVPSTTHRDSTDPAEARLTAALAHDIAVESVDVRGGGGPLEREDLPLFFRVIDLGISGILLVGFVLLLGVVGYNVFGRVFIGRPVAWADEAARYLFIWLIFLGAAVAYFRREHIAVGFLVEKLPHPLQVALAALQDLIVLGVLGMMMWGSVRVIETTFGTSALLGVPANVINWSVPVSAALMALMAVYRLVRLALTREV